MIESVIQEIIDPEFSDDIGAEPYDRQAANRDYRNGYKPRQRKTRVGEIKLSIPQAHNEPFRTQMFHRYQRSERAFLLSLQEMVINVISTRKVRKITEQLCGITFPKSLVLKLTTEYVNIAKSENESTWSDAFINLKRRGLKGVKLVVSEAHEGLRDAIDRHFQGCLWQRCQCHYLKNVMVKVRKADRQAVKVLIDDIYQTSDLETALEGCHNIVQHLADRYPD